MRAVLGILSLLLVLATVGLLAKKQLAATRTVVPVLQPAADAPPGAPTPATVRAQSEQVQQQVKKTVEDLMQQPRPMPEGEQ